MSKLPWGWRHLVFLTAGLILVQCSGTLPVSCPISQPTPSKIVETVYPSAMVETAYPAALVNPIPEQVMPYPAPPAQPSSHLRCGRPLPTHKSSGRCKSHPTGRLAIAPGEYQGEDGFIRISYLPEMAFMQQARRVCEHLANSPNGEGRKVAPGWEAVNWICAPCRLQKALSQPRTG